VHISLHALALVALAAAPSAAGDLGARLDAGLAARPPGAARASWATSLLVGAPYRTSPLGEGSGPDPDPRFRLDAFDCVTLVETAIALGSASAVRDAERLLDDVRYEGSPSYGNRSHYVEGQWIPALVRKGWIEPATRAAAGGAVRTAAKRLDARAWSAAERAGHVLDDLPPERRPVGEFSLEVVPLGDLLALASRVPDGTVLIVVREDRPSRPYRVTHMGLLVARADGSRALRHASDVPGVLRVRDEPLDAFVRRAGAWRWRVEGVGLYRIRDNTARAGAILGGAGGRPGAPPPGP
jgi:hypothetical protein